MSGDEDWEKWAEEETEEKKEVEAPKKESEPSKTQTQIQKSKESDMQNVFDLFGSEDKLKDKKLRSDDFKKIGENFAQKMNTSSVTPVQAKDFVKSLIATIDKKLSLKEFEEIYAVVDEVYRQKKKKFEEEEAKKKKTTKGGPPKGISWGKTKGPVDLNDDGFNDDDDDFM